MEIVKTESTEYGFYHHMADGGIEFVPRKRPGGPLVERTIDCTGKQLVDYAQRIGRLVIIHVGDVK